MAKLLLVEDDNNLREIYEARLQAEGYTIVSAKDGEEALVVAKAEKPDLVISDVMMPKISGFEMLDILRNTEELKGVKVIMLTALGQSDDQQRADKLGADRYLVKSQVTLEDIVKVTHELLGDQSGAPGAAADAGTAAPDTPTTDTATAGPPSQPDAKPDDTAAEPPADPAPAPEPKPEPKPGPKPDGAATSEAAKSTVQEEADVDAKIEDFVAGATSEPTTPTSTDDDASDKAGPDPSPAPAAADDPKGGVQGQSSDSASDDKLMADAVESLVASTDDDKPTPTPAAGATTIPVNTDPDEEKATPPKADEPPAKPAEPAAPATDSEDGGSTGSRKIIKPLASSPKKDITQLLAEEEAKEVQVTPGATVIGTTASETEDRAAGEPMLPPSSAAEHTGPETQAKPETDPGSIAL